MFIEYRKGVLNMGGTISEKELEKYDYLRAEYFKKNGRWPYTPRPLTNYEKAVLDFCDWIPRDYYIKAKTYADIPLKELEALLEPSKKLSVIEDELGCVQDGLLPCKGEDFSKGELEEFLGALKFIYDVLKQNCPNNEKAIVRLSKNENDSILGYFSKSKYYNDNKSELAKKILNREYDALKNKGGLKDFYFDPGDVMLLCTTVFKSIPRNARVEINNREIYLSDKKSRDYSDFMDMRKRMIELYKIGEFTKGDELLRDYTGNKYELINGVARNSFDLELLPSNLKGATELSDITEGKGRIIDRDFFIKTVIELAKLRKKLKRSSWGRKNKGVERLYRGIPLYKLLQKVQKVSGKEMPKELEKKHTFEKNLYDEVAKYLVGKVVVDPAPSSTSLDISVAKRFSSDNTHGTAAILVIDVSKYRKGLNLAPISKFSSEKEILLPLGVKLEIKSVNFKKEGSDGYFEVNCVPRSKSF